jgi:tRNA pseudouridine55 synthase
MDGALVVDKTPGMTSHDVVNRVRRLAGTRRVGHLGTLDPLATGVLPMMLNRATRLAQYAGGGEKIYEARVCFGYSTDTYDREGQTTSPEVEPVFTRGDLEGALEEFRGTFLQTPPAVSAKKIAGTPAYKLARKQIPVDLKPVEVTVFSIELKSFESPCAEIHIHCSAGTYIRAIAHELGLKFGCGAVLDELRRTRSGSFTIDDARTLDDLGALAAQGRFEEAVIPLSRLLPEFPSTRVDDITAGHIRQGRDFHVSPFRPDSGARLVKAVTADGDLVAIGEARLPHVYHPVVVL